MFPMQKKKGQRTSTDQSSDKMTLHRVRPKPLEQEDNASLEDLDKMDNVESRYNFWFEEQDANTTHYTGNHAIVGNASNQ
mmetsp:Transcript_23967/g.27602  ORF Transcript_23967/g.27602 Transcript_23967/m.27602 type:complete len:80 (+) Transcript_23967:592-831(+)